MQLASGTPSAATLSFTGPDGTLVILEEQEGMTYSVSTEEVRLNIVPLLATLARMSDSGQLLDWLKELEDGIDGSEETAG